MNSVMEKKFLWFAVIITVFCSLLASCRAIYLDHEVLAHCIKPLIHISESIYPSTRDNAFVCSEVLKILDCIDKYSKQFSLSKEKTIITLYSEVIKMNRILCIESQDSDAYVNNVRCIAKNHHEFTMCLKGWSVLIHSNNKTENKTEMSAKNGESLKDGCSAIEKAPNCSHPHNLQTCDKEAAKYYKDFIKKLWDPINEEYCKSYRKVEDNLGSGSQILEIVIVLVVLAIVFGLTIVGIHFFVWKNRGRSYEIALADIKPSKVETMV